MSFFTHSILRFPNIVSDRVLRFSFAISAGICICFAQATLAQGPPPLAPLVSPSPAPAGNPVTTAKTNLGKVLFWDEQLSSTRTISCGTCHQPVTGGSDPRAILGDLRATHPGADGIIPTADDVTGSPGVISNNADGTYSLDAFFGLNRQVTGRYAPSAINAGFPNALFWDGRAGATFRDPVTNTVVLAGGAALESQAAGPPTSSAEMAHQNRDWTEIATRIEGSRPLAVAESIPAALTTWISDRNYPALFTEAFGDPAVTPSRIIMAIATYERTLVSNESPFDALIENNTPLTAAEARGLQVFNSRAGDCRRCHGGNLLTDQQFHYLGVRPRAEDLGRGAITGNANDNGEMKTPSLRNVELRGEFMHNGAMATLEEVVDFYIRGGDFETNNNAINPLNLNAGQRADLLAFLRRPLTDTRVTNETAPFDRPTLFSGSSLQAQLSGSGVTGAGNVIPNIVAIEPPLKGNPNFTLGVSGALAGADAVLVIDDSAIASGAIPNAENVLFHLPVTITGTGHSSVTVALPADASFDNLDLFAKWFVTDPAAAGGLAETASASFTTYGESAGQVSAPSNLTAMDGSDVTLNWDEVTGAEFYEIYRDGRFLTKTVATSYSDSEVEIGQSYEYQVGAVTATEAGPLSAPETGEAFLEIPTNLTATDGASLSEINLAWDAVTSAVGYSVHRATADSFASAAQIATPAGNSFSDTTATDGVLYYYWVRSSYGAGEFSAESTSDSGHLLLVSPNSFLATLDVAESVDLSWAAVSGAGSYEIYRNTSDDSMTGTLIGNPSATSFSDTTATSGTTYYYWVRALSANGFTSSYSSSVQGVSAAPDAVDAFSSWIRTRTTDPSLFGFEADADGNGVSNGEDFIWPRGNTASAAPNGDQAALTFVLRDSAFDDIAIHVERSTDLVSWTRISSLNPGSTWSGTISLNESTGEGVRTVEITDLAVEASGRAVFFRVEAEYVGLP